MKERVAHADAVDLLEADHEAIRMLFVVHAALCDVGAAASAKGVLVQRICQVLSVHAQIEEEIFYPLVRKAIGDEALMHAALQEHAEAKEVIARIESLQPGDDEHDAVVKQLGMLIDQHVIEERELIFAKARQAALDLRGMTPLLAKRQRQLMMAKARPCAAGRVTALARDVRA